MPTLTLEFDDETYEPQDEYPWTAEPPGGGLAIDDTWSAWIEWITNDQTLKIDDSTGIYVIERNGAPVYAGKAASFVNRFNARSTTLHEFGLVSAVLPLYTLRVATVESAPPTYPRRVALAEQWLIRFLYWRDFNVGPHLLQNVKATGSFTAPPAGLSVRYDPNAAPTYLHDAHAQGMPGFIAVNANSVGFDYAGGTAVLP